MNAGVFILCLIVAVFSLMFAVLADRIGRRRLLIASVAGCALCNVATAFAPSGLALASLQLCARFFMGAQILLASVVVTEELSADNRGWGLGVLSAVGGMGGALTLLVYAFVDHLPFGWRFLFVVGGFGLLCVPWLWRSLQEKDPDHAIESYRALMLEKENEPRLADATAAVLPEHEPRQLDRGRRSV